MKRRTLFRAVLAAIVAFAAPAVAQAADVTVFAAASLSDALKDVGTAYQKKTGHTTAFSFAASSVLAKQIEAAAYADMFVSADTDWMDYLDNKSLVARDTRRNLLGNQLVLISPADLAITLKIKPHFALAKAIGNGRLAIASPDSVPAGKYGKAALIALGVWDSVSDHLAQAENVRIALAYVARGEAPLGIVYTTDAKSDPHVRVVDTFPESTHSPIVYPVALTKDAKPLAKDFLAFLSGPEARAIFVKDGFVVLEAH